MQIFIATHKLINFVPSDSIYVPIHVGAALHSSLPYIGDDTGNNISFKNPNYCELTAYYWIWKNVSDDVVGISHYRRYFVSWWGYFWKLLTGKNTGFLSRKTIEKDLKQHDVIVSTKAYCTNRGKNIYKAYARSHKERDMKVVLEIIDEFFPDYSESARQVMQETIFYPANMMICSKKIFDEYSKWLFTLFFELERRIDITDYDDYQKRIYGFLSERIFRIWLLKNKLRLKERHIINIEDGSIWKMTAEVIRGERRL